MLNYNRTGPVGKPIVVFIHGFLGSEAIYKEQISELKQDFDLVTIDLPGHGNSPVNDVEKSVEGYVKEIEKVLQAENIDKATWVGHSMGGYLVLSALQQQLPTIEKAVLAYSAVNADDAETKEKRSKQQNTIRENGVRTFVQSTLPAFFKETTSDQIVQAAISIGNKATEEGLISALDVMKSRPNQQQTIDSTTVPVLIIEGEQDGIVKKIDTTNPQVQKVTTNTGHLGMMELPTEFSATIKKFITADFV